MNGTCQIGEINLKAGQDGKDAAWYICTKVNTWTVRTAESWKDIPVQSKAEYTHGELVAWVILSLVVGYLWGRMVR